MHAYRYATLTLRYYQISNTRYFYTCSPEVAALRTSIRVIA